MSFQSMKKNRMKVLDSIKEANAKPATESVGDNRFWKMKVDKAGNGQAVIRFLPTPDNEDLPYVKYFSHFVQGPSGLYYSENCPTTISKDCPVCEANRELWNSGYDTDKEVARKNKRKINYVSNILVLRDPANPENEGKSFLFSYGVKIYDMLMAQMNPEFDDEEPVIPFDFWEGADFKLRAKNVGGYRNYDSSLFNKPSELYDGDEDKLKSLYESLYSLVEFVDPGKYKSDEELGSRWKKVMGSDLVSRETLEEMVEKEAPTAGRSEAPPKQKVVDKQTEDDDDDSDSVDSFFAGLADED
jgi:hypothetical protein